MRVEAAGHRLKSVLHKAKVATFPAGTVTRREKRPACKRRTRNARDAGQGRGEYWQGPFAAVR